MLKKVVFKLLYLIKGGVIEESRKKGVIIGDDCKLNSNPMWGSEPWLIELGNHVELSFDVVFITHDGATWCFRNQEKYKEVIRYGKIIIKDNCFIGARSTILPGVTIGPNSIVGAGSLVCKDVQPDSVYAGVPAKRICSIQEYADKCLKETPAYDLKEYKRDKKRELLRVFNEDNNKQ